MIFEKGITKVGKYTFTLSTGIQGIYYTGLGKDWNSISIETNNEHIVNGNGAFDFSKLKTCYDIEDMISDLSFDVQNIETKAEMPGSPWDGNTVFVLRDNKEKILGRKSIANTNMNYITYSAAVFQDSITDPGNYSVEAYYYRNDNGNLIKSFKKSRFEIAEYTVTFKDYDNTTLQTKNGYMYGQTPVYSGSAPSH